MSYRRICHHDFSDLQGMQPIAEMNCGEDLRKYQDSIVTHIGHNWNNTVTASAISAAKQRLICSLWLLFS